MVLLVRFYCKRIHFDSAKNTKSRLFEAQRKPAAPGKQIDSR
jgi:hypothetical protein